LLTDVSEENIASIFMVEEYDKQDTSMKEAASRDLLSPDCTALYSRR
jgi:hypothetical protein